MFALIVMSVCPSANLSLQQVTKLGGNVPLSAGVVAITSLISLFTIPIFLKAFETILNRHINVEAVEVIRNVAITIFLPMVIGMILRKIFPNNIWLAKMITNTAFFLLIVMVILITIHNYPSFANFKLYGYSMITIAVVGSYILGVLMSGKKTSQQISLGIESALRNPGLAILIANHNFAAEKVLTATVPYVVTTIVVVILCTLALKLVHKFIS
jgi:BASS family bile acid:Na+ symporter